MELLTPELREQLLANGSNPDRDRVPAVKWFNPAGAGTWLIVDADPEDPDIHFGLMDLGFGTPELGSVRLSELEAFQGPFGLGIERDLWFEGRWPISVYAEAARRAGRIVEVGPELDEAPAAAPPRRNRRAFRNRSSAPSHIFRSLPPPRLTGRGGSPGPGAERFSSFRNQRGPPCSDTAPSAAPADTRRRSTRWTRDGAKA